MDLPRPTSMAEAETVDTLIVGARIVTMDAEGTVFDDGAIALRDDRIFALGDTASLIGRFPNTAAIDGTAFVITPGLINGHAHVTGDPLARAWLPDFRGDDFGDELVRWVLPRFQNHSAEDEYVSAQIAGLKMLASGTTTFVEAGTVNHLDSIVAGLDAVGIRGRVGAWVEGRSDEDSASATDAAIETLGKEIERYPCSAEARVSAWPILVGHTTNPDEVWLAAMELAREHDLRVAAHMSPYEDDTRWYLENVGRRPIEHLSDLGVLGEHLCLTHLAWLDENEARLLAETNTNGVLCPLAALRGGFGLSIRGRFPELVKAGMNLMLGSDGYDADMWRQMQFAAGLWRDAREDRSLFDAQAMLSMVTTNGARGMGLDHLVGSLEEGKKADLVCHDTRRPEWQPLQNILYQLAWLADGRSVHSVWVDGVRVLDNYRSTLVDEDELYRRATSSSLAVMARAGLSTA